MARAKATKRVAATTAKRKAGKRASAEESGGTLDPIAAPGSPQTYRARVRMYRQGLGDCFLLTFRRKKKQPPLQILIDCGALGRDKAFMTSIVQHIRDTVRNGATKGKARLDVVVGTHEHKDHLSGFNQARDVFNNDIDVGAVWLAWTENLTEPQIRKIKETKKRALARLQALIASPLAQAAGEAVVGVAELLGFSEDDDTTGSGKVGEALEYLKVRGKDAGDLRYLEPGMEPFALDGLDDVRVYVLGPPRDPLMLKTSAITEKMKRDDVVYHLSMGGDAGIDALAAALPGVVDIDIERFYPFAPEHRVSETVPDPINPKLTKPSPYFAGIQSFVDSTYDDPKQAWRRIDNDWLSAFGQLALNLDSDTNNTSLVLAFEFQKTREVLLFVADAQVGSWQSWGKLNFKVSGRDQLLSALDLLRRTVFYKVGHHCSHNATLKNGGLELMNREDLVAFIPLDQDTAKKQGTKGWVMPAPPLFEALVKRTGDRVVLSDTKEQLSQGARKAGIVATDTYIDYFLK